MKKKTTMKTVDNFILHKWIMMPWFSNLGYNIHPSIFDIQFDFLDVDILRDFIHREKMNLKNKQNNL